MALTFTKEHVSVLTVREDGLKAGWERWFLLSSDRHHDNLHARHDLELRHLEEARARDAHVLDFGDLFCVMQGRGDKRADPRQMRPELVGRPYLDAVVDYNAGFYRPFADRFALLTPGNHEASILKHAETNLTERLGERLKAAGSPVQVGPYRGWVRFLFTVSTNLRSSVNLHYTHGYGGGGPMTMDVLQVRRQLSYLDNVDILVSGHTHDQWHLRLQREGLSHGGEPRSLPVDVVKCGGYKDEFSAGQGFAAERGHPPKPLGAAWLRFYVARGRVRWSVTPTEDE